MIRNYVVLFLLLFTTTLQSQNVFRMVTDGAPILEVPIDDSTYQVVVNLLSDITGGSTSYYASGIQTGYQLFTASFQLYDITSVVPDGLFQARLIIRRVNNDIITTNGPPKSQAMVFFPLSTDKLPQVPFSSIAAGPLLQEKISTYNALVSAIAGSADDWGAQSVESDPTLLGTGVIGDVLKADTTILSTKYYTQTQRDSAYTWSNTYTDTTLASAEALIYDSIGQVASQISTLNTTIIDSTASALNQAQLYADSLSTAPAGGDLSGNYPNPTVVGIQTIPVSPATPINGQGFVYQNGQWVIGNFDPSSTNELQTLYFDPISDSLFLSNGNSVHMPGAGLGIGFNSNRPILRTPTVGTVIGDSTITGWLEYWYFTTPTVTTSINTSLVEVGTSQTVTFTSTVTNPSNLTLSNGQINRISPSAVVGGYGDSEVINFAFVFAPQLGGVAPYTALTYSFNSTQDYTGAESGTITGATRAVTAVYPVLYGMSATDLHTTGNAYTGLSKSVSTEGNKNFTMNGTNQYIYYAIPSTWPEISVCPPVERHSPTSIGPPSGFFK